MPSKSSRIVFFAIIIVLVVLVFFSLNKNSKIAPNDKVYEDLVEVPLPECLIGQSVATCTCKGVVAEDKNGFDICEDVKG